MKLSVCLEKLEGLKTGYDGDGTDIVELFDKLVTVLTPLSRGLYERVQEEACGPMSAQISEQANDQDIGYAAYISLCASVLIKLLELEMENEEGMALRRRNSLELLTRDTNVDIQDEDVLNFLKGASAGMTIQ